MSRPVTFEQAKARYLMRYTMEHVPQWARQECNGRYYAPHFRTDREWYDNTKFKGEDGWLGVGTDCYTTGQTWPLGQWLDKPYTR
jgi:hypothetical protein